MYRFSGIPVHVSDTLDKGSIVCVGTGDKYPEGYDSWNEQEQLRWAVSHSTSIIVATDVWTRMKEVSRG